MRGNFTSDALRGRRGHAGDVGILACQKTTTTLRIVGLRIVGKAGGLVRGRVIRVGVVILVMSEYLHVTESRTSISIREGISLGDDNGPKGGQVYLPDIDQCTIW